MSAWKLNERFYFACLAVTLMSLNPAFGLTEAEKKGVLQSISQCKAFINKLDFEKSRQIGLSTVSGLVTGSLSLTAISSGGALLVGVAQGASAVAAGSTLMAASQVTAYTYDIEDALALPAMAHELGSGAEGVHTGNLRASCIMQLQVVTDEELQLCEKRIADLQNAVRSGSFCLDMTREEWNAKHRR